MLASSRVLKVKPYDVPKPNRPALHEESSVELNDGLTSTLCYQVAAVVVVLVGVGPREDEEHG